MADILLTQQPGCVNTRDGVTGNAIVDIIDIHPDDCFEFLIIVTDRGNPANAHPADAHG